MESNKENKEEEKKLYQRFSEAGLQYSHAVGISSRREKKENNERRVIRPLWIFLSTFTFPFFVRFFPFRFLCARIVFPSTLAVLIICCIIKWLEVQ